MNTQGVVNKPGGDSYRERQRWAARQKRTDALQSIIIAMVTDNPTATILDIRNGLEASLDAGVVVTVTDQLIEWIDKRGAVRTTPVSALPNRATSARKSAKINRRYRLPASRISV